MKWIRRSAVAAVIGLLTIGAVPPVAAQGSAELPAGLIAELTTVWTEHGMTEATQSNLIAKVQSGATLDSMTEAEPVDVTESVGDGELTQTRTYADGSINVLTLQTASEVSDGEVGTTSVDSCSSASGFRYNDCLVFGWFNWVQLSFRASYVIGTSAAQIVDYNSPFVQCFTGVTCDTPFFSVTRLEQDGSAPAEVGVASTWQVVAVGTSSTTYLRLYVQDTSAWTD